MLKVQSLIQANPHQIIPLGFLPTEDLSLLYNLATVYIQPSLAEGFGLPVLEAMACGCPVLIGPADSLSEIAGPAAGEFNQTNLKLYWQSANLRLKMSQLGLTQAAKFSWEKTAKETIKVYESI